MKWLWPISWYYRIKELETQVALLIESNRQLDAQMRAQAISHAGMNSAYIAGLASLSAAAVEAYKARRQAEKRL